jgi:hypothetical protein
MPVPALFAFLTGLLVSAAYSAFIVVFWGLVYIIGCIIIVVQSPKICKGIFAGSCGLGSMVGGALTAVTSAAMGMTRLGAATGLLGSGAIGQAVSAALDVPLPGGNAAGSHRAPKPSGTESSAAVTGEQGSKPPPASMEAILATGTPTENSQASGAVSRNLTGRERRSAPASARPPAGTILGVDGQPMDVSKPGANDP